ncbi:hypothetical protein EJ02DRAFT_511304 [Clathrospora elynae]|uniref:Uncharacterized protein n=1 Tax=Clathrospora elynae TaxID=706981 RepID=A0A6A5SR52_9PLEO|nr:hypothetical protein EJ02DRAFT_511304 [Clathrospora elynae]
MTRVLKTLSGISRHPSAPKFESSAVKEDSVLGGRLPLQEVYGGSQCDWKISKRPTVSSFLSHQVTLRTSTSFFATAPPESFYPWAEQHLAVRPSSQNQALHCIRFELFVGTSYFFSRTVFGSGTSAGKYVMSTYIHCRWGTVKVWGEDSGCLADALIMPNDSTSYTNPYIVYSRLQFRVQYVPHADHTGMYINPPFFSRYTSTVKWRGQVREGKARPSVWDMQGAALGHEALGFRR